MLHTSTTKSAEPRRGVVKVSGNSRAGRDGGRHDRSGIDNVEVNSGEVGDDEVEKKGRNLYKSKKTEPSFLTSRAREAFTDLRQAFIKALIFYHFDQERYIRVETDASGYAIA